MKQQRRRTCLTVLDKWHTLYGTPGWLDLRHCSGKPTHVIFRRSHGNAIANAWCKTMPSKVCKTKHKYNKKTCWQIPRFSWSGRILQTLKLGQASVPAIISLSNSQSQPSRETFKVGGLMPLMLTKYSLDQDPLLLSIAAGWRLHHGTNPRRKWTC